MSKWEIKTKNEIKSFDSFGEAATAFKKVIKDHLNSNDDVYGSTDVLPFNVGAFFNYKYDSGSLTDSDIIADYRLELLLQALKWSSLDKSREAVLKAYNHDIEYKSEIKEFNEMLYILIAKEDDECWVNVVHIDGEEEETHLKTNAFLFGDEKKQYYFYSRQIITTSSKKENLGKEVALDVTLDYVDL